MLDLESADVAAVEKLLLETNKDNSQADIDVLCDIFNTTNIPEPELTNTNILLPMSVSNNEVQGMICFIKSPVKTKTMYSFVCTADLTVTVYSLFL